MTVDVSKLHGLQSQKRLQGTIVIILLGILNSH